MLLEDASSHFEDDDRQLVLLEGQNQTVEVVKPDSLIHASYTMGTQAMRVFNLALDQLPPLEECLQEEGKAAIITIPHAFLIQTFPDLARQRLSGKEIGEFCEDMTNFSIRFFEGDRYIKAISVVEECRYDLQERHIEIMLTPGALTRIHPEALAAGNAAYTRLPLHAVATATANAWRLRERIIREARIAKGGWRTFVWTAGSIKETLQIPERKWSRTSDLFGKLVEPAIKAFNDEEVGFSAKCERVKTRNPKTGRLEATAIRIIAREEKLVLNVAQRAIVYALRELGFNGKDIEEFVANHNPNYCAEAIAAVRALVNVRNPGGMVRAMIESGQYLAQKFDNYKEREEATREIGRDYALYHLFYEHEEEDRNRILLDLSSRGVIKAKALGILRNEPPEDWDSYLRGGLKEKLVKELWPELLFTPIPRTQFVSRRERFARASC